MPTRRFPAAGRAGAAAGVTTAIGTRTDTTGPATAATAATTRFKRRARAAATAHMRRPVAPPRAAIPLISRKVRPRKGLAPRL
ncbi:hypothetical protein C6T68_27915 [Burkholderia multivorans]|nr:hypothetical protein C6T68_27915 [Burkholderia multivorans]